MKLPPQEPDHIGLSPEEWRIFYFRLILVVAALFGAAFLFEYFR